MKDCIFFAIVFYLCLSKLVSGTSSSPLDQKVCEHDLHCKIFDSKLRCNQTSKMCECKVFYQLKENKCQLKQKWIIFNLKCNNTRRCLIRSKSSYCNTTSGFCACLNEVYHSGFFCLTDHDMATNDQNCTSDSHCTFIDQNSMCDKNTSKCVCKESYNMYDNLNRCQQSMVKCISNKQCNESNNEHCQSQNCNCKPLFTRVNGICTPKISCGSHKDCPLKKNFRCDLYTGKCQCRYGFSLRGDTCEFISKPCTEDVHCNTVTEACNKINKTCKCRDIYYRFLSGECKLKLGYCNDKTDCGNTAAFCDDDNRCKYNLNEDSDIRNNFYSNDSFNIIIPVLAFAVFVNLAICIFLIHKKKTRKKF